MAHTVYTISSDESESDADNDLPALGAKFKARREDSDSDDEILAASSSSKLSKKYYMDTGDANQGDEENLNNDNAAGVASSGGSAATKSKAIGMKRKSVGSPEDKGKKKATAALEKLAKKQKLAQEKAARKIAHDMNKIYKPGECMKYMNIEGHPSLWSRWYMSDVSREAAAAGARVVPSNAICDPALIMWTRTLPRVLEKDGGQVKLSPAEEPCDRALYVASADDICELVSAHTLASHLAQIQQLCDSKLTLLVFRVSDYFKSTRRKTSNSNRAHMTEIDFEMALTDLLVSAGCDTVIANTPNELALTIVQFTKAIAEAPFKKAKRACDEQADFYMRGDNKKCIAVDKDGIGVGRLWQQMIAILPQSSLETSRALCAQYKSPLALLNALQSVDSIAEVANIGVSRAAVAGSKARRVGPEFARKLHTLFTAQRGDELID